jgi:DNA (cytosine-5)-methyltransferase 1
MKVGSLFTGIGGFDLGLERAGMKVVWQAEKDKHARSVLRRHWPDVRLYEDVKHVGSDSETVDLICGGFPCTDVSTAGKRAGLAGEQSGLWFEFLRILREVKPEWVVIENVPGLLSSNSGRDFAVILHGLGECGYKSGWRILDAQYWGVAQRRRRLFIVGNLRDGRAAEVLFERNGGEWNTPTRKEAGQGIAAPLKASPPNRRNGGSNPTDGGFALVGMAEYSPGVGTLRAKGGDAGGGSETLVIYDLQQITSMTNQSNPKPGDPAPTLTPQQRMSVVSSFNPRGFTNNGNLSGALQSSGKGWALNQQNPVFTPSGVRRLTPVECERLQGFPDDWTAGQSDTQRYKELGNAVCVGVAHDLGERIMRFLCS